MLINIDEKLGHSAILGHQGQYKLLNGTFTTDNGFYGEDGRGLENPPYDYDVIINSAANTFIQKIPNTEYIGQTLMLDLRGAITLSDCRSESDPKIMNCDGMCLFDVLTDPCEVRNLINSTDLADVVEDLKTKLDKYVSELVPQTNWDVGPNSDPVNFNGTWSTWLQCNNSYGPNYEF